MFRVLFLGDIVGEPGRRAVLERLPVIKKEEGIDLVVANGENAAAGRGITPKLAMGLLKAGVSMITMGDHVWDQKEIVDFMELEPRVLRPVNYPDGTPGQGYFIIDTPKGPFGVINVQGRTFMQPPLDNPFTAVKAAIASMREHEEVPMILVDVHAETTSEKVSMGHYLDGEVSIVVGTHTHVQTADEKILPGGTAYLTDAGMCGPAHSVIGREIAPVLKRFETSMPQRFPIEKSGEVQVSGMITDVDEATGHALAVRRFFWQGELA